MTLSDGTITFVRNSYRDAKDRHHVTNALIDSTGAYEGLHWSWTFLGEYDLFEPLAHFAPPD